MNEDTLKAAREAIASTHMGGRTPTEFAAEFSSDGADAGWDNDACRWAEALMLAGIEAASEQRDEKAEADRDTMRAKLKALVEAGSELVANALACARLQVRGYGMMGKLAYLGKAAETFGEALRAAKENTDGQ